MLYSESMEGRNPLAVAATPVWPRRWSWSALRSWWTAPEFDAAVALGGSHVEVTAWRKQRQFPAMLAYNARQKCVAVGEAALGLEGREPEGVTIQQPMRGGAIHDPHGAKLLLEQALRRAAPRLLLAIGARPTALERETWEALGRSVGARQVSLTSELLASAVGAGLDVLKARCQMVFHIGAGRCEVGVIGLGSCLAVRKGEVAGEHVDEALQEYVRRSYQLLIHRQDAERLKRTLAECANDAVLPVSGRHLESGAPLRVNLKAQELIPVLEPFRAQWVGLVLQFLSEIPIEWVDDIQDNGIHLTGGSTALQGLAPALRQATGLVVSLPENPAQCTGLGLQTILKSAPLRRALFCDAATPKDDYAPRNLTAQRTSIGWSAAAALMGVSLFLSAASARSLKMGSPDPWLSPLNGVLGVSASLSQPQDDKSQVLSREERRQWLRSRAENRRLWSWLGRRETNQNGVGGGILARVSGRDPHQWMSGIRLDVGKKSGVRVGDLVMAEQGLLGKVAQVDERSCRVKLCLEPTSVVAGLLPDRKSGGVVQGRGMATLQMKYLDPDSGVKKGDVVVTSGQDGLYPKGLPIGKIIEIRRSSDSSFLEAKVAPWTRLDTVSEVMVLHR